MGRGLIEREASDSQAERPVIVMQAVRMVVDTNSPCCGLFEDE